MKRTAGPALIATGLLLVTGCSSERQQTKVQPTTAETPSASASASPISNYAAERVLLHQAEVTLEAKAKASGSFKLDVLKGVCSVVQDGNTYYTMLNPGFVSVDIPQTGETLSVAAGYNPATKGFVFGTETILNSDATKSTELPGVKEKDLVFTDFTKVSEMVSFNSQHDGLQDSNGDTVASVASIGQSDKGIEDYAKSDMTSFVCSFVDKSSPIPPQNA